MTAPPRRITWWSALTVALAVPVWYAVIVLGVMPRSSLDGGIFVSVIGGLKEGLPLYSGVWDNKDPLFFLAMLGASLVRTQAMFAMDWVWTLVGAIGVWLLARPVMSGDRALLAGAVLAPVVLLAPFHEAGLTSLPGTAVALLAMGLLINRWGVAGGIAVGLLAFLKLLVWPVALAAIVVLVVLRSTRTVGFRALIAMAATVAAGIAGLAVAGWLAPYIDALGRNRTYASDVIVYFGYADSPLGHLQRLAADWTTVSWVAVGGIAAVAVAGMVAVGVSRSWRDPDRVLLVSWLLIAVLGTSAALALTYVWGHHAQAIYLPALLAVVVAALFIPARWVFPGFAAVMIVVTWVLVGWGSPSAALDQVSRAKDAWSRNWATVDEKPTDAKLLGTVQAREFSFARLGSNDDKGFLYSVPAGAKLACAQFHLYDFSPPSDFERMLQCIQDVDVVLMTDSFVVFGNGGRAASVQPILQYVDYAFDCLRVADRQVCTRKPA